jgi:hypothetical protein
MSTLAARFSIVIDRAVNAPAHGKNKVDSQNGIDKSLLSKAMCRLLNPEVEVAMREDLGRRLAVKIESRTKVQKMPTTSTKSKTVTKKKTVAKHIKGKKSAKGKKAVKDPYDFPLLRRFMHVHDCNLNGEASLMLAAKFILEDPTRVAGVKDRKSAKRQANAYFRLRNYLLQNKEDVEHSNITMSWQRKLFPVLPEVEGQPKIRGRNGVLTHYHFRLDPNLGAGKCAIRRIPCACPACVQTLLLDWDPTITIPKDQPRYQPVKRCHFHDILGKYNNWIIMEFNNKGSPDEDLDDVHAVVLKGMTETTMEQIEIDGYGAVSTDDPKTAGYYIVRFTTGPYTLQSDHIAENGDVYKTGELVCDAVFTAPVTKKGPKIPKEDNVLWYVEPRRDAQSVTVALQTVAVPDLNVSPVLSRSGLYGTVKGMFQQDVIRQKPLTLSYIEHHRILDAAVRLHCQ